METAVVNFKTNKAKKAKAQKKAASLGVSLSTVLNHYLETFLDDKTVRFGIVSEEPTPYLLDMLRESEAEAKAGKLSPTFTNAKEASAWLNERDDKG